MLDQFFDARPNEVVYPGTVDVPLTPSGKPKGSWMRDWTQEQRTEKFFEFCRAYDKREDSLLQNYQQFSHRLHWDECPFVDVVSKIHDRRRVYEACVLFSFTNEHWGTFTTWLEHGTEGLRKRFETERHSRSDLFQIYYPKGTSVRDWLLEAPARIASSFEVMRNTRETMMGLTKRLDAHMIENEGFRSARYPCKNVARHVAMTHPDWVSPDSFLHGGTGFFDGLCQVFDDDSCRGAKYDINEFGWYNPTNYAGTTLFERMEYLAAHPSNPIRKHVLLNIEDKLCMFYKHMAIRHGVKKTTASIPYSWVYPENWSLKTGAYS